MKTSLWYRFTLFWKVLLHKKTPTKLKLLFIAGIIYGVSPVDLIPETIPFIGLVDDIALLIAVINYIWKKSAHIRASQAERTAQDEIFLPSKYTQ